MTEILKSTRSSVRNLSHEHLKEQTSKNMKSNSKESNYTEKKKKNLAWGVNRSRYHNILSISVGYRADLVTEIFDIECYHLN